MKPSLVLALSLLTLSGCFAKQPIKPTPPIVTAPASKPIRQKPVAAMVEPPPFPIPPADLDQQPKEKQATILGLLFNDAAEAYATVARNNYVLIDYINTETCHGE
jgi:hypothetical protein